MAELPGEAVEGGLWFSNVLCGVIRGALEMVSGTWTIDRRSAGYAQRMEAWHDLNNDTRSPPLVSFLIRCPRECRRCNCKWNVSL